MNPNEQHGGISVYVLFTMKASSVQRAAPWDVVVVGTK